MLLTLILSVLLLAQVSLATMTEKHNATATAKDDFAKQRMMRVVPLPTDYTTGDQIICLSADFSIKLDDGLPEDLMEAAKRTERRLFENKHQLLTPQRGAELLHDESEGCKHWLSALHLSISHAGDEHVRPASIMDSAIRPAEERPDLERYSLSIPLKGPATIKAPTALGVFRGLTTFENLFFYHPKQQDKASSSVVDVLADAGQVALGVVTETMTGHGGAKDRKSTWYAPAAPYQIEDKPAFGWRAVLLDTSRNWFGKEAILKACGLPMLDTMAMVKLNVFHWHITDSNSWPMDLASHPELAREGAYSSEQKYTEEDIKEIIKFAGHRGIDVMLEIDTPGHTASIAESHPELIAGFERTPWQTYAGQPPAGQLRFASQKAVDFTKAIFESTLDLVAGHYFSTGGDELNEACMLGDEETVMALKEHGWTLNDALDDFTGQTHAPILERKKTPLVWQEMVLDHGDLLHLSKEAIVDIWINSDDARKVLDKGFRIVHASSNYFYLDNGHGSWIAQKPDKPDFDWGTPFRSWQRIYSFDPYKDVDESQRRQVLGGQVSLWAEQTDETNFETVLWPRAAALAELFWTGGGKEGYPRSAIDALPRMHDIRYRLVDRGVRAEPLQPHWCALRPEACAEGA